MKDLKDVKDLRKELKRFLEDNSNQKVFIVNGNRKIKYTSSEMSIGVVDIFEIMNVDVLRKKNLLWWK